MRWSKNILTGLFKEHGRLPLVLFFSLTISILVVSIIFFALSMGKPYMGATLSIKNGNWEVSAVDSNGHAIQAGIEEGNEPTEINGQPAQTFLKKYVKHGVVFGLLITELTVTDDTGRLISVAIKDSSQSWESLTELTTWFIVCIIFWIIGFYVFLKKPRNRAALLFCLCGLVFGLAISGQMAGERAILNASWVAIIASIIGPWLLLHFFIILPDERVRFRETPLIYLIYFPTAITLILFPLIGYADGQPLLEFRNVRLFEYGIGFLAVAIVAILNYIRATSIRTRQQMKLVLIGCLLAVIPFIVVLPLSALGNKVVTSGFYIIFIAFIPLGLGYAVIKEKLLDIDILIRRSLVYSLIIIVMAVILSSAVFIGINFQESFETTEQILLALVLGVLATILFGPIKRGIEILIDKAFYKDRYDYRQIIQNLSAALKLQNDSISISRLIVGTTANTLNLAGACLFISTQTGALEIKASQGTFSVVSKQKQLLDLVYQPGNNIYFPSSVSGVDPEIAFLIPLVATEKDVGILCLSPKRSNQDFTSSDYYLIQGLATVAAIGLHSMSLIRDVSIRDTFVSIASHELRTPMSSIMGYAELLLQRDPPKTTREQWIQNIIDNGHFISSMVDDLLNVTRIQAGKIIMNIEEVDLSDLVKERVNIIKEIDSIHEFSIDVESDLPKAAVDRDKFGQIISNLLDNAVKYSPNGKCITLSIKKDKQKNRILLCVVDEGIGIGDKDKEKLFSTFHRIQRPETRSIRGNGLGLFIVKEWTEAMEGKVWLESELDKGSTFFILVPIADMNSAD